MAKLISINDVVDGMIAAQDIMTNDGHVLLAAGTILTKKHLGLLQKREVESLMIQELEEEFVEIDKELPKAEETSGSVVLRLAQERLKEMFADVREDQLMEKLLALAMNRAERITINTEGKSNG